MSEDKNQKLAERMEGSVSVLRQCARWRELFFYQKADALYQLTFLFCRRFLPPHGDRTVDQMVQAARSGKQNIVEGSEDGMTSTEMELRLLNVARSSLQELREDYEDYLKSRGLAMWTAAHPRYDGMLAYCRVHNRYADYEPFVQRWTDEEMGNGADALPYDRPDDDFVSEAPGEALRHPGGHQGADVCGPHGLPPEAGRAAGLAEG